MDDGGKGDGKAGRGLFVDPEETVGGEDEKAGTEGSEARVLALKVDCGEEAALDLAGEKDWAAGGCEGDRRQPVRRHGIPAEDAKVGVKAPSRRR